MSFAFFFFNDTATTEIYTLSLHDALPILSSERSKAACGTEKRPLPLSVVRFVTSRKLDFVHCFRSEEHTSELQSHLNLVCRLLLEKKKILSTTTCIFYLADRYVSDCLMSA